MLIIQRIYYIFMYEVPPNAVSLLILPSGVLFASLLSPPTIYFIQPLRPPILYGIMSLLARANSLFLKEAFYYARHNDDGDRRIKLNIGAKRNQRFARYRTLIFTLLCYAKSSDLSQLHSPSV